MALITRAVPPFRGGASGTGYEAGAERGLACFIGNEGPELWHDSKAV